MDEFNLINQFFKSIPSVRQDVLLGIGDDAACLNLPLGESLLVSTDTLVSGQHFLANWSAYDIAYRAVMVNISDMAAMAATPAWITLALTLPQVDTSWLHDFSQGLKEALQQFNVALVGGDTTRGPLAITLTIMGHAKAQHVAKRSGAQAGDYVFVSGPIGGAALAVKYLEKSLPEEHRCELMTKLLRPTPRTDLSVLLQHYATAAIDISDGLSADLNHLCVASHVGACLQQDKIPLHPLLSYYLGDEAPYLALTGGDDYELCFTVAKDKVDAFMADLKRQHIVCYPIGVIEKEVGLRLEKNGLREAFIPAGYSHF